MPARYSFMCKVCNSPHRLDIERWAQEDGLSSRAISRKLAAEFEENIGHKSVWQHLKEHFDIKAEARELYAKSQEHMRGMVEKHVSDIEKLDAISQGAFELHMAAEKWLKELVEAKAKPPQTLVELWTATAAETRQHVKQKQELLGDDPESKKADAIHSLVELVVVAAEGESH